MTDQDARRKGAGQFKILDEAKGEVSSIIATLNVIDSDRDVTLKGFFGTHDVAIARAHRWDELAVGKGQIVEDGDIVRFDGMFNMRMPEGKSAFESVAFQGDIQEWSYGFHVRPGGQAPGEFEGKTVNFLKPLDDGTPGADPFEVSPVLKGAGQGTRTLAVKGASKFADHIDEVLAEVQTLVDRSVAITAIRAEKGGSIGDLSRSKLDAALAELDRLADALGALTKTVDSDEPAYDPNQLSIELLLGEFDRRATTIRTLVS